MKSLLLKSILLVSHREKKAKKIRFHPQANVVKGQNDTGKSSLIKSIYFAFGAKPHSLHHKWKNADVAILLRFEVDDVTYSIYRHRNSFSLFDKSDHLIGTYSSVTKELAPVLANIFDFKLKLVDRGGQASIPPPAYLFLPFYIDQDKGWVSTWNSFTNLGQFPNWKKRVISYHLGIRPDKWYELEAERKNVIATQEEPERQLRALEKLVKTTREHLYRVDFDINVDQFKSEIKRLLDECNTLKIQENRYRQEIVQLRTEQIRLDAQIEIVVKTHDELSQDYKFAVQHIDNFVSCPTCGAEYNNSFTERFEIARDTETCTDLLMSLRDELKKVSNNINISDNLLSQAMERQVAINKLLTKKQGQIKLKDLIELEGKKTLIAHLDREIIQEQEVYDKLIVAENKLFKLMKDFDDPERKKKITKEYGENLRKNVWKLEVTSLDDRVFKRIDCTIEESGSDLPRAVLAYNFSVLKAIEKNGNATFCPIVIDAPNQQEQDQANLGKILKFISKNRPSGHQLILGLVDDSGIDFGGKTIELRTKYSLLDENEYQTLSDEIRYFETRNFEYES